MAAALLFFLGAAPAGAQSGLPLGTLPIDSEVVEVRKLAQSAPLAPIPGAALFGDSAGPLTRHCRFHRLGPGPRFSRDLTLVLGRVAGSERADGSAAEAHFGGGVPSEESSYLPLWYDARGQLLATVTLPPPPPPKSEKSARLAPEQPGQREEFVVFRWLPQSGQLVGEWQRATGAEPAPASPWASLPSALLVGAQEPYAASLRATAYLLCAPVEGATASPRSAGRLSTSSGGRRPDPPGPSAPKSESPAALPSPAPAPTPRRDPAVPARP